MVLQVLVRNVPPDPDESINEHVEHFFCVNHPDHYLCHQVCFFSWIRYMNICNSFLDTEIKETISCMFLGSVQCK